MEAPSREQMCTDQPETALQKPNRRRVLLLVGACLLGSVFLVFWGLGHLPFAETRGSFQKTTALALKKIHLGLLMFAGDDPNHCLPSDLGELHDSGTYTATKIWVIPGSGTKQPQTGDDIRNGLADYILLVPGQPLDALSPDSALMITNPRVVPQEGISVLLRSGEVRWYEQVPAEVKQQLQHLHDTQPSSGG